MTLWALSSEIPAGIVAPSLVIGGLLGRIYAHVLLPEWCAESSDRRMERERATHSRMTFLESGVSVAYYRSDFGSAKVVMHLSSVILFLSWFLKGSG